MADELKPRKYLVTIKPTKVTDPDAFDFTDDPYNFKYQIEHALEIQFDSLSWDGDVMEYFTVEEIKEE